MTKKKVLIVISSLKIGGGAERVAATLGTELYNRKYEIHFLTFYKHSNNYEFKGKHVCLNENFKENVLSKGLKLFSRARKIAKYCKKHNIDTCVSFMEAANFPTILSRSLFGNKSKIVISIHNNPNKLYDKKTEYYLMKLLYNKSHLIIGVSEILTNKLKKLKLKNLKTIYNINNISEFTSKSNINSNLKIKFDSKDFTFINIGRLNKQKGQKHLIRAFSKINYENKKLLILGEGNKREELEKLIKSLQLEKNVFLLGNIGNVYPYIKQSNCFVLSSIHEGFGLTLVEALSLNTPVISTDCQVGPREILAPSLKLNEKIQYPYFGEFGILTKPFSNNSNEKQEQELSKMMEKIIGDKKLQQQYSKGLKRAKDFNISNIIKEWEKIL